VAQVGFSRAAFADFERIFEFYAVDDAELARAQVDAISEAVAILDRHPLIGRAVKHGFRELVISRGKTGFVALYRFSARADLVTVLRIRHQRELGYP
jgi:plasmid stabilization system protein ParE